MGTKRYQIVILAVLVVLGTRGKSYGQGALGSAFTYQGKLLLNDEPVNGRYDFKFKLYEDSGGTIQVENTFEVANRQVTDGLFTAKLNFGPRAFTGPDQARWLEIAIKSVAALDYIVLTPRVKLTAAPFALGIPGLWFERFNDNVAELHAQFPLTCDSGVSVAGNVYCDGTVRSGSGGAIITIDGTNQKIIASSGTLSLGGSTQVTLGGITFPDGSVLLSAPESGETQNSLDAADGDPPQVVFVDTIGRVGVGTTAPTDKLTLYAGDFALRTDNNTKDQSILFRNVGASYTWRIYRTDAGGNSADLRFAGGLDQTFTNLPDLLTIQPTGKVGIVTTNPQGQLHVGGTRTTGLLVNGEDGSRLFEINRSDINIGAGSDAEGYVALNAPPADSGKTFRSSPAMRFRTSLWNESSSTTDAEYWLGAKMYFPDQSRFTIGVGTGSSVVVDEAGLVGIGKLTPEAQLDVEGLARFEDARVDNLFEVYNSLGAPIFQLAEDMIGDVADTGAAMQFYNRDEIQTVLVDGDRGLANVAGGKVSLYNGIGSETITLDGGSTGSGALTVLGEVGIGTTTPFYALHVVATGHDSDGHIAKFENTGSTGANGIAIQLYKTNTNAGNNFLTFYNSGGTAVGAVEGFYLEDDAFDVAGLEAIIAGLPSIADLISIGSLLSTGKLNIDFLDASYTMDWPSINWDNVGQLANVAVEALTAVEALACWARDNDFDGILTTNPFDIAFGVELAIMAQTCKNGGALGPGGVTYKSAGADYAEWLPKLDSDEDFRFGQIVGVYGGKISKKTTGADNIMAISRTPVVLGNVPPEGQTDQHEKVGFMGQVYVLVRGHVSTGDYILPSGHEDGTGLAVSPHDLKIEHLDKILGRAWSDSSSDIVSMITVAVGLNTNEYTEIIKRQQDQIFERDREFATLKADHSRLKAQMDKVSAKLTTMLTSMEKMNAFMVSRTDGLGYETRTAAGSMR